MTIGSVSMSIIETGKSRRGWKQWIIRYNGVLPDALVWVPEAMDPEAFMGFCHDLAEPCDE